MKLKLAVYLLVFSLISSSVRAVWDEPIGDENGKKVDTAAFPKNTLRIEVFKEPKEKIFKIALLTIKRGTSQTLMEKVFKDLTDVRKFKISHQGSSPFFFQIFPGGDLVFQDIDLSVAFDLVTNLPVRINSIKSPGSIRISCQELLAERPFLKAGKDIILKAERSLFFHHRSFLHLPERANSIIESGASIFLETKRLSVHTYGVLFKAAEDMQVISARDIVFDAILDLYVPEGVSEKFRRSIFHIGQNCVIKSGEDFLSRMIAIKAGKILNVSGRDIWLKGGNFHSEEGSRSINAKNDLNIKACVILTNDHGIYLMDLLNSIPINDSVVGPYLIDQKVDLTVTQQ